MSERSLGFLLTVALVGIVAQFVDGALGMGYGIFSSTLLVAAGFMPAVASASIHTAEIFTTLLSGISHHTLGNVDRRLVIPLTVSGVVGGVAGALFLSNLPGDVIKPWVAGMLLLMGVIVTWRFLVKNGLEKKGADAHGDAASAGFVAAAVAADRPADVEADLAGEGLSTWKLLGIGFVAAALDAFGGGGWGPVTTPTLLLGHNVRPHRVVGSVNVAEFFVTLAISITFFITIGPEHFDWTIVGLLLVGGLIAAPIAAWLTRKLPTKVLGILIGVLLILTNIRTIVMAIS